MAAPVVQVEGARQLRASMRRAGEQLNSLGAVHRQVGGLVIAAAHPPVRTGRLAGSMRPGAAASMAVVRAGGAGVRYANFVHWGARGVPARPFLTDAAHRTEPRWMALYMSAVQSIVDRIRGV